MDLSCSVFTLQFHTDYSINITLGLWKYNNFVANVEHFCLRREIILFASFLVLHVVILGSIFYRSGMYQFTAPSKSLECHISVDIKSIIEGSSVNIF